MRYAMSLWEPFDVFRNFPAVAPGFFDSAAADGNAALSPKVDILDDGENFVVSAELPGVSRENLDIDLRNNRLTVRGKKDVENREETDGYVKVERSRGSFERSFFLDDKVDAENIKAEHKDGVLRLTLPKKREEVSKKIEVD